jgi:hypothetical protein
MARDRGQALIETMLLTWLMIAFFAAVYQMFQVNQTIYRSMTAVQQKIFGLAFQRNQKDTDYDTDTGARAIWRPAEIPEVVIPTVGMFSKAFQDAGVDPSSLRLSSNARTNDDDCPGLPCKRTKMGSGNYREPWAGLTDIPGIVTDPEFWNAYAARITGGF